MDRRIALLVAWLTIAACGVSDRPPEADETEPLRPEPAPSLDAELVELRFEWSLPHILEGERRYLAVEAVDDLGNVSSDVDVRWSSSQPMTLRVTPDGEVVGLQEGRAEVRVIHEGLEATMPVEVRSSAPFRIEISSTWVWINALEETVVRAVVYTDTGVMLARPVQWWSDDPEVAEVDDGRIRAVAPGSTLVHAAAGAAHATVRVEVADRSPD